MEVVKLIEVESTNSWAKVNIDSLDDKTIVVANHQTNGRGRLNRTWIDLGGDNLFLSFVLKPSESFNENYPNITQYLSVVLSEVLEDYGLTPQIKWPNDVLVEGKKIAGILSETVMEGQKLKGLVLGLGVNLNAGEGNLTLVTDKVITSLNLEVGKDIDVDLFFNKLSDKFFENYAEFLEKGFEFISNDYIKRICVLNKDISVQVFNKVETGLAEEITNKGELVLRKDNDEKLVLTIGDIL